VHSEPLSRESRDQVHSISLAVDFFNSARRAGIHHKILFIQPSKLLIDRTVADMKAQHPKVRVTKIHGR
jgi:hypothetical protein